MLAEAATYAFHDESVVTVAAAPDALFRHLDDPRRLGAHMSQSSAMMAGSRMSYQFDAEQGRTAGSRITMTGTVLGLRLRVDEVVTEHTPLRRKTWETIGEPRLLVIGAYRMGFAIEPDGPASRLWVFIDYGLPHRQPARTLGRLLGRAYARWCVRQMARDAAATFASKPVRVESSQTIERGAN